MLGAKYGFTPSTDFVAQAWILAWRKFPTSDRTWYYQLLNKSCGTASTEHVDVRQSACTQAQRTYTRELWRRWCCYVLSIFLYSTCGNGGFIHLSAKESNNKLNPHSTTTRADLLPRFARAAGHRPLRPLRVHKLRKLSSDLL